MDPVTQKPPSGDRPSSGVGLSFEFLVHLIDLSKKISAASSVALNLPAAVLFRSMQEQPGLPFRFEFPLAKDQKSLERFLSRAMSDIPHRLVVLEVKKEDDRLIWSFRGQGEEHRFTSSLILSRPQSIRLEGLIPDAKGVILNDSPPLPQEFISATFIGSSVLPDESVIMKHGILSAGALTTSQAVSPVAVWPHYASGKTVELTIRWFSQEERNSSEPGGTDDIVFSLDIPWKGRQGRDNKMQKVRLTGVFSREQIVLNGRHLPKNFLEDVGRRSSRMSESLRLFPGISLVLDLVGDSSDAEKEPSH